MLFGYGTTLGRAYVLTPYITSCTPPLFRDTHTPCSYMNIAGAFIFIQKDYIASVAVIILRLWRRATNGKKEEKTEPKRK